MSIYFIQKHVCTKHQDTAGRKGVTWIIVVRSVESTVVKVVVVVVATIGSRRPDVVRVAVIIV